MYNKDIEKELKGVNNMNVNLFGLNEEVEVNEAEIEEYKTDDVYYEEAYQLEDGRWMTYYVFENDYNIEIFTDKAKAIIEYEYQLSMMTESEKKNIEYYRLYEIETQINPRIILGDLIEYMTSMILKLK